MTAQFPSKAALLARTTPIEVYKAGAFRLLFNDMRRWMTAGSTDAQTARAVDAFAYTVVAVNEILADDAEARAAVARTTAAAFITERDFKEPELSALRGQLVLRALSPTDHERSSIMHLFNTIEPAHPRAHDQGQQSWLAWALSGVYHG